MKFKLNNVKWTITEKTLEELQEIWGNDDFFYGQCDYVNNIIYLNKRLCLERKKDTLIHELTHCWTMSSGWGFSGDADRETICNIVACSNYFINDIVKKYFKRRR